MGRCDGHPAGVGLVERERIEQRSFLFLGEKRFLSTTANLFAIIGPGRIAVLGRMATGGDIAGYPAEDMQDFVVLDVVARKLDEVVVRPSDRKGIVRRAIPKTARCGRLCDETLRIACSLIPAVFAVFLVRPVSTVASVAPVGVLSPLSALARIPSRKSKLARSRVG